MNLNKYRKKDVLIFIIATLLAMIGFIGLYVSHHLPTSWLDNLNSNDIPFFETFIRGWLFSEKINLIDFEITLLRFAAFAFLGTIIILIFHLVRQRLTKSDEAGLFNRPIITILLLLTIFSASLLIRSDSFNKPLGLRYEILTSDTLIRLEIWKEQGALKHFFVPSDTYSKPTDKNIKTFCSVLTDKGECYYLSYPPGAIILPYLPIALLNFRPSLLYLQIINLLLHLVTAVFVYLITALLTKQSTEKKDRAAAVLAFSFYTFSPVLLTMHSESFFADMVAMPFFAGGIYFFLDLLFRNRYHRRGVLALGLFIFLTCYSEWLGVLFAGTVAAYALLHWRHPHSRSIFLASVFGAAGALILSASQFISAVGPTLTLEQIKQKILLRAGISNVDQNPLFSRYIMNNPSAWLRFPFNYLRGFGLLPILIIVILARFFRFDRLIKKRQILLNSYLPFVWVAGLPVLLHHLLLFQWSTLHYFSPIKAAPLLTVLGGILVSKMIGQKNRTAIFWQIATMTTIILLIFSYLSTTINQTDFFAVQGDRISKLSRPEDVIFIRLANKDEEDTVTWRRSILSYYAHRNIALWEDLASAKQLLQKNNALSGVLFEINNIDQLSLKHIHFTPQSTEEEVEADLNKYKY
ncbi:hypothetical protein KKF05_02400 [Patescibacteria group bacterium]|nr:hypothetical protein [Patescibacteria group bacterium]